MKRQQKHKIRPPQSWWILNEKTAPPVVALGAMVVVILFTLLFNGLISTKKNDESTNVGNTNTEGAPGTQIVTADGVTLAADIVYPAGAGPFPVVILIHEFGQDRHQWDDYHDVFLDDGLAVLSYDTRGFGQSAMAAVPNAQAAYFASMANDAAAAVAHARAQPKIDSEKVFLIGAGAGANIALAEAARNPAVNKTILLSPGNTAVFGSITSANAPGHVLGIADQSEQAALDAVMVPLAEPKKTVITQNGGRGVAMLEKVASDSARQWLSK